MIWKWSKGEGNCLTHLLLSYKECERENCHSGGTSKGSNAIRGKSGMGKVKVPIARIHPWSWLAISLHICGQYVVIDSL